MTVYMVVPCGAGKVNHEAPARELYTGSAFQYVLGQVEFEAQQTREALGIEVEVLILSALHGLVRPETVLAPYDVKMGDAGSIDAGDLLITALMAGVGCGDEVFAFLPRQYREMLEAALAPIAVGVQNVYEAAPGIGYMRGVCRTMVA
jgi:hypothetical protein